MALIDQVRAKVKDDSARLTDEDDYYPAIAAALERYSKHRPRQIVDDRLGAGFHDVVLPEGWVEEFSRVVQVEYPVDNVPASIVAPDRWQLYAAVNGTVLRLLDHTPEPEESVRVTITVPRIEETVIQGDLDAVASLAASFCCETLATLFTQTSDPTIAADVVNYRSKSAEFSRRAKRLADIYHQHVGVDPEAAAPGASVVASPPTSTRVRLTH